MHILVTGGNGFLGSHLVAAAVDAGHTLTVLDVTQKPRYAHNRPFQLITTNTSTLSALTELLSTVDVVCHLAYSTVPSTSNDDPVADIAGNLISSVRLLETMRRVGKRKLIYLSSGGAVYGSRCSVPISEDHPLDPISSYGVTKVAFEKYLGMYATLHGLEATILRPSNPYGPGRSKVGVLGAVNTFLHAAATGGTATIWGDGSQIRDFIHVDDMCRLLLAAITNTKPGVYNCGRGVGTSISELVSAVERVTGRSVARTYSPARGYDPTAVVLDIGRARQCFGWSPRVDLDSGLLQTWEWMQRDTLSAPRAPAGVISPAASAPQGTAE